MKKEKVTKIRHFLDYIIEIFMEFREHLFYALKKREKWTSNLTEEYLINCRHKEKPFVCDFLNERQKTLAPSGYRVKIMYTKESCEENLIGKVTLRRKNKIISTATLKTKSNATPQLIYWIFEKQEP